MNDRHGFSLVEVLVTMVLLGILMAVALPPLMTWRQNMTYRSSTNDVASALKTAKSRAIQRNSRHQVLFNTVSGSYRVQQVNGGVVSNGRMPREVFLNLSGPLAGATVFNSNGTALEARRIRISDSSATRYTISVERTGRIRVEKAR